MVLANKINWSRIVRPFLMMAHARVAAPLVRIRLTTSSRAAGTLLPCSGGSLIQPMVSHHRVPCAAC